MTKVRIRLWGTMAAMLMRLGSRRRASRYWGKVSKHQSMPARRVRPLMPSTSSRVSMTTSRSWAAAGAMPKPQLPITAVVTPCQDDGVRSGSQKTWASRWVWMSMKPGASTRPVRSISSPSPPAGHIADRADPAVDHLDVATATGASGTVDDQRTPQD